MNVLRAAPMVSAARATARAAARVAALYVLVSCGDSPPAVGEWEVHDVRIVDVRSGVVGDPVDVRIRGRHIASIVPAGADPAGPRDGEEAAQRRRIDGAGHYLIPGLWDMHVHVLDADQRPWATDLLVAHGVTGIRDMGTSLGLDQLRQLRSTRAPSAESAWPRIVAAGPVVDGPGRAAESLGPGVVAVSTTDGATRTVAQLHAGGADFVKVSNRLTPQLMDAVLAEARRLGIPVVGHVPVTISAAGASRAGMASMEHLQGVLAGASPLEDSLLVGTARLLIAALRGQAVDPAAATRLAATRRAVVDSWDDALAADLFRTFVEARTWHTPTLVANRGSHLAGIDSALATPERLRFIPPITREAWANTDFSTLFGRPGPEFMRARWQRLIDATGQMHRAGVPLLAGTDAGAAYVVPGYSLHEELALLVRAGLTPAAALRSATLGPAQFLGTSDSLGTVETGKLADLVLLGSNPLESIEATRDIEGVFLGGEFLSGAVAEQMKSDIAARVQRSQPPADRERSIAAR